jgi:DNA-binding transcriptional LysR family regulator
VASARALSPDLNAFEAAARLSSFTRAADELEITQPAVSQRVRRLESRLGASLFIRRGRGVSLSTDGMQLWLEVKAGMDRIEAAIAFLERRNESDNVVTLAVSNAFANLWLLPRLGRFREGYPSIELRVVAIERPEDLAAERMPLCIRLGEGSWPGHECWMLAPEIIYPVCSPRYVEMRPIVDAADLARHRLIHLHETHRHHVTWGDWFKAMNLPPAELPAGFDFNDYALAIRTALAGEGVALGWDNLVRDLLASRELVAPVTRSLTTGSAYWLVTPRASHLSSAAIRVRDWVLAEVAEAQRGSRIRPFGPPDGASPL